MVPLSKRLTCAWEWATGKDIIYSEAVTSIVLRHDYGVFYDSDKPDLITTSWIEATPVSGEKDRYTVTMYENYKDKSNKDSALDTYPLPYSNPKTYSRSELANIFCALPSEQDCTGEIRKVTHPFALKELPAPKPA